MSLGEIFSSVIALAGTIFGVVILFKLGASLSPWKNKSLINIFYFGSLNLFVCALLPIFTLCFGNSVAVIIQIITFIVPFALLASLLVWWKRTEPEMGLLAAMDKHLYGN